MQTFRELLAIIGYFALCCVLIAMAAWPLWVSLAAIKFLFS